MFRLADLCAMFVLGRAREGWGCLQMGIVGLGRPKPLLILRSKVSCQAS